MEIQPKSLKKQYYEKYFKSKLSNEPPSFKYFRKRAQSQDSIINILFPDKVVIPLTQNVEVEQTFKYVPIKWSLKKIFNIVEKQSQVIQSSSKRLSLKSTHNETCNQTSKERSTHVSRKNNQTICNQSKEQNYATTKKVFKDDLIDESSRQRLSKFLANQEIVGAIKRRSLSRKKQTTLYDDEIESETAQAQIKQIQHQATRHQYRKISQGAQTERPREPISVLVAAKQDTFRSVYSKIQQLTNNQSKKKIPITQHRMLSRVPKQYVSKPKIRNKLEIVFRQVLYVCKYMCKHKIWFNYPLDWDQRFFQSIIQGDYDQVQTCLLKDPQLVHLRNYLGQTPLHVACICNNISITELLIKNDAHLEALDNKRYSPLFYSYKANSHECFKCLLLYQVRPWSPPGGKINQHFMNLIQKNQLMHARLVWMIKLWKGLNHKYKITFE